MRAGVAEDGIISPVLFRLCVNYMPLSSCYFDLALYMENTAVIATSSQQRFHQIPGDISQ
jgi:hypothetical protein